MPTWQLLVDGRADGVTHMELERHLLHTYQPGISQPILHFYEWAKPTLSIGRLQTLDPATHQRCEQHHIPVVKRPTGGQAILHDADFTFSIIASTLDGFSGGLQETYQQVSRGILAGLKSLGIDATMGTLQRSHRNGVHCFQEVTSADIQVDGAKLVGSAQFRRHHVFLQQSVIYLARSAWRTILFPGSEPAICYLNEVAPRISVPQLQGALATGFGLSQTP